MLPEVRDREPLLDLKERGVATARPAAYEDIVLPKNSPVGALMGGFAFVFGFAMIWYIWWLAALCGLVMWALMIWRSSDDDSETVIPAAEVARLDGARLAAAGVLGTRGSGARA